MDALPLIAITFAAAVVNGALGYGFSTITVPLALLFLTNRVLNPALVLVEVVLNAYVLWVNRTAIPRIHRRMLPLVFGLVPGVVAGTFIVSRVDPDWLRLGTFSALLPLILVQAAGFRRPVRCERSLAVPCGAGVGVLYSVTTISGPPLAVMLNNQGLAREEFRASLAFVRLAESAFTAAAYAYAGLYTAANFALLPSIVPSLVVGVPLGAWFIRRLDAETFRRVCMSFDAWVVSFGVSSLLQRLGITDAPLAYSFMAAVVSIDAALLYRFFTINRPRALSYESPEPDGTLYAHND
jgi:uncharacterized membrane protein YfcA